MRIALSVSQILRPSYTRLSLSEIRTFVSNKNFSLSSISLSELILLFQSLKGLPNMSSLFSTVYPEAPGNILAMEAARVSLSLASEIPLAVPALSSLLSSFPPPCLSIFLITLLSCLHTHILTLPPYSRAALVFTLLGSELLPEMPPLPSKLMDTLCTLDSTSGYSSDSPTATATSHLHTTPSHTHTVGPLLCPSLLSLLATSFPPVPLFPAGSPAPLPALVAAAAWHRGLAASTSTYDPSLLASSQSPTTPTPRTPNLNTEQITHTPDPPHTDNTHTTHTHQDGGVSPHLWQDIAFGWSRSVSAFTSHDSKTPHSTYIPTHTSSNTPSPSEAHTSYIYSQRDVSTNKHQIEQTVLPPHLEFLDQLAATLQRDGGWAWRLVLWVALAAAGPEGPPLARTVLRHTPVGSVTEEDINAVGALAAAIVAHAHTHTHSNAHAQAHGHCHTHTHTHDNTATSHSNVESETLTGTVTNGDGTPNHHHTATTDALPPTPHPSPPSLKISLDPDTDVILPLTHHTEATASLILAELPAVKSLCQSSTRNRHSAFLPSRLSDSQIPSPKSSPYSRFSRSRIHSVLIQAASAAGTVADATARYILTCTDSPSPVWYPPTRNKLLQQKSMLQSSQSLSATAHGRINTSTKLPKLPNKSDSSVNIVDSSMIFATLYELIKLLDSPPPPPRVALSLLQQCTRSHSHTRHSPYGHSSHISPLDRGVSVLTAPVPDSLKSHLHTQQTDTLTQHSQEQQHSHITKGKPSTDTLTISSGQHTSLSQSSKDTTSSTDDIPTPSQSEREASSHPLSAHPNTPQPKHTHSRIRTTISAASVERAAELAALHALASAFTSQTTSAKPDPRRSTTVSHASSPPAPTTLPSPDSKTSVPPVHTQATRPPVNESLWEDAHLAFLPADRDRLISLLSSLVQKHSQSHTQSNSQSNSEIYPSPHTSNTHCSATDFIMAALRSGALVFTDKDTLSTIPAADGQFISSNSRPFDKAEKTTRNTDRNAKPNSHSVSMNTQIRPNSTDKVPVKTNPANRSPPPPPSRKAPPPPPSETPISPSPPSTPSLPPNRPPTPPPPQSPDSSSQDPQFLKDHPITSRALPLSLSPHRLAAAADALRGASASLPDISLHDETLQSGALSITDFDPWFVSAPHPPPPNLARFGAVSSDMSPHERTVLALRRTLGIASHRHRIERHIAMPTDTRIVFLQAATGTGKSTQIPQYIVESCAASQRPCRVVVAQPRRVSAVAVASRIAEETGTPLGAVAGYHIRGDYRVEDTANIVVATYGILCRLLTQSGTTVLDTATHIILDEVHERSSEHDLLLSHLLSMVLASPRPLAIVLMSATLDGTDLPLYVRARLGDSEAQKLRHSTGHGGGDPNDTGSSPPASNTNKNTQTISIQSNEGFPQPSAHDNTPSTASSLCSIQDGHEWTAPCGIRLIHLFVPAPTQFPIRIFHPHEFISKMLAHHVALGPASPLSPSEWGGGRHTHTPQIQKAIYNQNDQSGSYSTYTDNMSSNTFADSPLHDSSDHLNPATNSHRNYSNNEHDIDSVRNVAAAAASSLAVFYSGILSGHLPDPPVALLVDLILWIHSTMQPGGIIVFGMGLSLLSRLQTALTRCRLSSEFVIILAHSSSDQSEISQLFRPVNPPLRKVVLASAICETAITIPDLRYCIDLGIAVDPQRAPRRHGGPAFLHRDLTWRLASHSSITQRSGRVGRTAKGFVFRLFPEQLLSAMPQSDEPEVVRNFTEEHLVFLAATVSSLSRPLTLPTLLSLLPTQPHPRTAAIAALRALHFSQLVALPAPHPPPPHIRRAWQRALARTPGVPSILQLLNFAFVATVFGRACPDPAGPLCAATLCAGAAADLGAVVFALQRLTPSQIDAAVRRGPGGPTAALTSAVLSDLARLPPARPGSRSMWMFCVRDALAPASCDTRLEETTPPPTPSTATPWPLLSTASVVAGGVWNLLFVPGSPRVVSVRDRHTRRPVQLVESVPLALAHPHASRPHPHSPSPPPGHHTPKLSQLEVRESSNVHTETSTHTQPHTAHTAPAPHYITPWTDPKSMRVLGARPSHNRGWEKAPAHTCVEGSTPHTPHTPQAQDRDVWGDITTATPPPAPDGVFPAMIPQRWLVCGSSSGPNEPLLDSKTGMLFLNASPHYPMRGGASLPPYLIPIPNLAGILSAPPLVELGTLSDGFCVAVPVDCDVYTVPIVVVLPEPTMRSLIALQRAFHEWRNRVFSASPVNAHPTLQEPALSGIRAITEILFG